ncbi:small kinetochore-associated protein-like isoform X1 [Stegostoma tigrinum]|uniref:small kinetochore-associated protein-like isoform X1 n=1 Tax=Stegostoma tigrinum TaxID=3053191 RepID=UPI00202B6001|nr:small kinetochore-associated protein-like isoform X1 [Stegostoma tigrinum]XP_048393718.1 small kinetochore-associated protein-like isoform X1 [Stegostoma tigrinum]
MQRSRLPVYRPRNPHNAMSPVEAPTAKMLRTDKILRPSLKNLSMNQVLPEFEKDLPRTFNFSQKKSSAVLFEATAQPGKLSLNKRKKIPPLSKMTRADMEKYMTLRVVETELRDQNQLLEVAQQQLKQELKMAKDQTDELMIRARSLQSEKETLGKRLQNCTTILENNLIDPVSANRIIEEHDQKNSCQRDAVLYYRVTKWNDCSITYLLQVHVENLQAELETWGKYADEKKGRIQEMRLKLENTKEHSVKIVQDTDLIQKELEEWRISLNQSKQLLHQDFDCADPLK